MIPHKTVEQVLETARIEEVVGEFVQLKRRGVNLIGLCPFHSEKTPSFTVAPSKNIFKCFGCGKGGSVANFLMEHEGFTFPEAIRWLAKKYNIEIEEVQLTPEMLAARQEEESLFILNDYARSFFEEQLFHTEIGKSVGLSYFKGRGFREETIKKFGLGFAPADADALTKAATRKGFKVEFLQKLGLTTQNGKDFFRNRVMFAIHNLSGKPVAFAGRILQKDAKAPKYINSPETDIYTKSKTLYGAYFAKKSIQKLDECILVEGYTDVISLHQAGIENVVASSGTSLTEGQIALIKRFTQNIKILYDGDPAGIQAALRGLDLALEKNMNVRVVLLPPGEDPDSYLNKVGVEDFETYLTKEAKDFILFKTQLLLNEVAGDPVKRAGLIRDIVESIAKIPDPFKRSTYIRECSRVMEVEERVLHQETNKMVQKILQDKKRHQERHQESHLNVVPQEGTLATSPVGPPPQPARIGTQEFKEKDLARLLVAYGDRYYNEKEEISIAEYVLSQVEELLPEFESKEYRRILELSLQRLEEGKPVNPGFFIGHVDDEISSLAVDLLHQPWEYSPGWEKRGLFLNTQKMPDDNVVNDADSALHRFLLQSVVRLCEKNQDRIKAAAADGRQEELEKLLKVQSKLIEHRKVLADRLNTVVLKG